MAHPNEDHGRRRRCLSLPAAAGDYLVQWIVDGDTYGAAFELTAGETPIVMELVAPAD